MDNIKTGSLIRERRKAEGFTQQELAERLHVTAQAVSKWERGLCAPDIALLEPLSALLGVTVTDLISGALPQTEDAALQAIQYSVRELTEKKAAWRKKYVLLSAAACLLALFLLFQGYLPAVFQRGDPLPYLRAAARLSEAHPYVQVAARGTRTVYLTGRTVAAREALFSEVACSKGFSLAEQNGSAYIFTDGRNTLILEEEIYLGRYCVWTAPNVTYES